MGQLEKFQFTSRTPYLIEMSSKRENGRTVAERNKPSAIAIALYWVNSHKLWILLMFDRGLVGAPEHSPRIHFRSIPGAFPRS